MKYNKQILILNTICIYVLQIQAAEVFVRRNVVRTSSENPTHGMSTFTNENFFCIFSYCWNKQAKCLGSAASCCVCKCKDDSPTFFSKSDGCFSGSRLLQKISIHDEDEGCRVFTKEYGFRTVPLFTNYTTKNPDGVELTLEEDFPLNRNVTCYAQNIFYYEYYTGTKTFIYHNMCQDMIKVRRDGANRLMFTWGPRAHEEWNRIGGLLLSVDIHCESFVDMYSSCFIFQTSGVSTRKKIQPQPTLPHNFTCPTEAPPTTTISPTVKVSAAKGINTSVIASVVIVIILVIVAFVVIFFLWKRRKARREMSEDNTRIVYDHRVQSNAYEDQKLKQKLMRENSLKNGVGTGEKDELYVEVPDEQEYTSIDEHGHEYETPVKIDMSRRPLPDRPYNINNPYYTPNTQANLPSNSRPSPDRKSEENQLYSLYSSIDNLKPPGNR